jgi:aconitate hydratase
MILRREVRNARASVRLMGYLPRFGTRMPRNVQGGMTRNLPAGEQASIYDAAMRYKKDGMPRVVCGGKEYRAVSSHDRAAKGTTPLGITGEGSIDVIGPHDINPRIAPRPMVHRADGKVDPVPVICRIDTVDAVAYCKHEGILQCVPPAMARAA